MLFWDVLSRIRFRFFIEIFEPNIILYQYEQRLLIIIVLGHCPSGDNPHTPNNEEDCHGRSQEGAPGRHNGEVNNRCHVDCSGRGVCNFKTGRCLCFENSHGAACDKISNQGTREIDVYY